MGKGLKYWLTAPHTPQGYLGMATVFLITSVISAAAGARMASLFGTGVAIGYFYRYLKLR